MPPLNISFDGTRPAGKPCNVVSIRSSPFLRIYVKIIGPVIHDWMAGSPLNLLTFYRQVDANFR